MTDEKVNTYLNIMSTEDRQQLSCSEHPTITPMPSLTEQAFAMQDDPLDDTDDDEDADDDDGGDYMDDEEDDVDDAWDAYDDYEFDCLPDIADIELEMLNIQNDLQELIVCLNNLVDEEGKVEESDEEDLESFMDSLRTTDKLTPYLVDDEISDCKRINWDNFGPFVDGIVRDLHRLKHLNRRTNEVVRRIRSIAFYENVAADSPALHAVDNHHDDNANDNNESKMDHQMADGSSLY